MNLQKAKELIKQHPGQFYTYILKRPNGQPFYVGKGNCKGFRIGVHEKEAKKNKGPNRYKINTIRKIWESTNQVDYEIALFTKDEKIAFDKEKELICLYRRVGNLVNITDGGEGQIGLVHSAETRKKFSDRMIGNTNTKGIYPSDETRKKMSEARVGKSSWNKGVAHTEEEKRKISIKLKGRVSNRKGAVLTDDQKQKISRSMKGKVFSEERNKKISMSLKGHIGWNKGGKHTEETKLKMSEAKKIWWAKTKKENSNGTSR